MTELDSAQATVVQSLDDGQIADARFSADRSTLVVTGERRVHLLNPRTLQKTQEPLAIKGTLIQAWLMAGNRWLLVRHSDGVVLQPLNGSKPFPLVCPGENAMVYTVAVSRDQRALALACQDGRIVRWDVSSKQPVQRDVWTPSEPDTSIVTALAFSHDASLVASGSVDGSVRVWRVGSPKVAFDDNRRPKRSREAHHSAAIRDIAFGTDSSDLLLTGSDDGQAIVWQYPLTATGKAQQKLVTFALPHDREVTLARFASQAAGDTVLTISGKDVRVWTDPTSTARRSHNDWAVDADVSDDGLYIASADADGTANVLAAANMAPVARLRGHRAGVQRALFLPGSHDVLTASLDGTLRLWSVRPPTSLLTRRTKWELGAAFHPADSRVVVCGEADEQRQCEVRDLEHREAKPLGLARSNTGPMSLPAWSSDGSLVLAQHQTNDVNQQSNPVVWDSQSGVDVTPTWLNKMWSFAAVNPSTPHLVTIDREGAMALWHQQALKQDSPKPMRQWPVQFGRVMAALSSDGRWLAAVNSNRVQLWRLDDDKAPPISLAPHLGTVKSVRFSRDNRLAVTASDDGTARVWRLPQPGAAPASAPDRLSEVVPYVALKGGHTGTLSAAAFGRADGSLVATASADNTVRIWDSSTGVMLSTLRLHGDSVNDVQFSADGEFILSASDDGTVRLTRCSACTLSPRQLRERVHKLPLAPGDAEVLADMVNGTGGWWDRLLAWAARR